MILEAKSLSHIYSVSTPFEHTALSNVDFAVERGEFLGLIGHTGSGKSTLVQHLNGLLKPASGSVLFKGEDIWSSPKLRREIRFKIGLVFQYPEYQLFEDTVIKDIGFGPKNMGLSDEEARERALIAANFAGVPKDVLDKSPFELSGGQKRRVAIAGVIAMQPEVLILDEPAAGLDPSGRELILENIKAYHSKTKSSVILVSHSMEDIARSADRIVVMNEGTIAIDGAPKEVFGRADEISALGLAVPQITKVFLRLKEMGMDIDTSVYTVEQARNVILSMRGGRRNA